MSSLQLDQNAFAPGQWSPSLDQISRFEILRDGESGWQAVPSGNLGTGSEASTYHRVIVHDPITKRSHTCLVPSVLRIFKAMKAEQDDKKHADRFYDHPSKEGCSLSGLDIAKMLYSNFTWQKDGTICSEIPVVPSAKQGSYRLRYTADMLPVFLTAVTFDSPVTGQPETRPVLEGAFPESGLEGEYVHTGDKWVDGQLSWGHMPTQAGLTRMFNPFTGDRWGVSQLVDEQSRWQPHFECGTADTHSGEIKVGSYLYRVHTTVWLEGTQVGGVTDDRERRLEVAGRNTALQLDLMPA